MIGTLNTQQIEDLMGRNVVAHLGCHQDGETYVVPISYVYRENTLYGHTCVGKKVHMMRANPKVCVEVLEVDDLSHWRSVICQGEFQELHGHQAAEAMGVLIDRLSPIVDQNDHHGRSVTPDKIDGESFLAVVYAIKLGQRTGRYEDG